MRRLAVRGMLWMRPAVEVFYQYRISAVSTRVVAKIIVEHMLEHTVGSMLRHAETIQTRPSNTEGLRIGQSRFVPASTSFAVLVRC